MHEMCLYFLNDIKWKSQPSGVPDGDISMISYQKEKQSIRNFYLLSRYTN